jgi:hypothetical protein
MLNTYTAIALVLVTLVIAAAIYRNKPREERSIVVSLASASFAIIVITLASLGPDPFVLIGHGLRAIGAFLWPVP